MPESPLSRRRPSPRKELGLIRSISDTKLMLDASVGLDDLRCQRQALRQAKKSEQVLEPIASFQDVSLDCM